jgi:hypothetical protein
MSSKNDTAELKIVRNHESKPKNTTTMTAIPNTNEIYKYLHCGLCFEEKPSHEAPRDWARLSVGITKLGLQVWCVRHDANVLHANFEGAKHPVNITRGGNVVRQSDEAVDWARYEEALAQLPPADKAELDRIMAALSTNFRNNQDR